MNDFRLWLVATAGSLFLQVIEPVQMTLPDDPPGTMLVKMLISILGGIISTVAYKGLALLFRKTRQQPDGIEKP